RASWRRNLAESRARRELSTDHEHGARAGEKSPAEWPGLSARETPVALFRRGRLGHIALERLVGFLGKVGIERTELAGARHEALVAALDEVGLHFNRLLEALGAQELLGGRRGRFERVLGVVGNLGGDGLEGLAHRAELLEDDIRAVRAEFVEV